MAPTSGSNVGLFLEVSETLREAASLLRRNETNKESKHFYTNIMAHCVVVRDILNRIKSVVGDNQLVQVLDRLEQTVRGQIFVVEQVPPGSSYPRLLALNKGWNKVKQQNDSTKLDFVARYLDLDHDLEQRDEFVEFFQRWEDDVTVQYPEDRSQWSRDEFQPPKKSTSEPSYDVWKEAQSLFKALLESKTCACHPQDDFGAGLCLGTYQKPIDSRREVDEDHHNFEMFLSVQEEWHEAHAHIVKRKAVKFAEVPAKKKPAFPPMKVKNLCQPIAKRKPSDRLEFKVDERDRLWKLRSEKGRFTIDRTKDPISLQQVIQDTPRSLTDKTKRILAVLLSYAVFHLHGTPWLPPSWGSSNILFFHTTSSMIPVTPFLRTQLLQHVTVGIDNPEPEESLDQHSDESDPDDYDPDDIDPDEIILHQCPSLVTLGVMLLELYLEVPFEALAEKYNVAMADPTRPFDVASVFDKCKTEMPENSQFYYAVEKCLDWTIWEDDQGVRLDDQTLRNVIYQEVIQPLEEELSQAFSYIRIDELDQFAQTVDFGGWGRRVVNHYAEAHYPQPGLRDTYSPHAHLERHQQQQYLMQFHTHPPPDGYPLTPIPTNTPYPIRGKQQESIHELDYKIFKFFDDETISEDHWGTASLSYQNWESKFKEVYKHYIKNPPECPVKIAILDTGIDQTHPDVDACIEQIKGKYSWVNEKFKKKVDDYNGHGTFTAALLLNYAPDAEVYVAKISDGKPASPQVIAKAIDHAINVWKVDIISMSFGFPTRDIDGYGELERAIMHAYSNNLLLFAAASNSGANLGRAYPARDQNVICIHSTDANGNRSPFSPTALFNSDNIATVGEAVESAWPTHLCDSPTGVTSKSGTSYATPIAVSMAAFLLQYARIYLPELAHLMKRQSSMKAVLRKIAEQSSESKPRDDYQYVALSRYSDNLFGKDQAFINYTLRDLLTQH